MSGPLIPSVLAARASLLVQRRDDWVDNAFSGEDDAFAGYREVAGRVQFLWTPVENFSGRFKVQVRDFDGHARMFRANVVRQGRSDLGPGFRRDKVWHDGKNSQTLGEHGFSAEMQYTLGDFRLISLTGGEWLDSFSRGDVDGGFGAVWSPPSGPGLIPFPSETADGVSALRQLTQEIRLESTAWQRLDWRVGFFYFHEDMEAEGFSYDTLAGNEQNGYIRQQQRTEAWAVFGAATLTLTENLEVAAGIRVSEDDKRFEAERLVSPIGSGPLGPLRRTARDLVPSWDLSLRYRVTPGMQPYVRVASSFRAPSVQGRLLFSDEVSVADTEGHHLGRDRPQAAPVAATPPPRRGGLSLLDARSATHRSRRRDQRHPAAECRPHHRPGCRGRGLPEPGLRPAPNGRHELQLHPAGRLGPGRPTVRLALHGARSARRGSRHGLYRRQPFAQAPRWIANASLSYMRLLPGGSALLFSTDWAYRSRINFFLYESREYRDNYLLEGGLRLAWLSAEGGLEVAAFGRNILNDVSRTGGIDFNNLTGHVNEPPLWGIETVVRF